MRDRGGTFPSTLHCVLAPCQLDRTAGNGILIDGSPSGKMYDAVVRFVDCQFSRVGDV
jgi:hypothetical protein